MRLFICKIAGGKGISEMKSKQQSPCSNYLHQPVMFWGNACSTCMHQSLRCMHRPVTSQADACTYCMGSVVLISSWIYLYSSYFCLYDFVYYRYRNLWLLIFLIKLVGFKKKKYIFSLL